MPSPPPGFSLDTLRALEVAFLVASTSGDTSSLAAALLRLHQEAHTAGHPPERIVIALKAAWGSAKNPDPAAAEAWNALYRDALTRSLALYFNEPEGP